MFGSFFKSAVSLAIAFSMAMTPVVSMAQEVDILAARGITAEGLWEAGNRESRYDVTYCGDGTQLCAELVWIEPSMIGDGNRALLNTYVVYEALRARPAEWRGDFHINGDTYGGSIKIVNQNELSLTGCVFLILCKSYALYRVEVEAEDENQLADA